MKKMYNNHEIQEILSRLERDINYKLYKSTKK